ncbi:hypothetical protein RsTz2092_02730 [Deferribacterales bacterium RsTz2092]
MLKTLYLLAGTNGSSKSIFAKVLLAIRIELIYIFLYDVEACI